MFEDEKMMENFKDGETIIKEGEAGKALKEIFLTRWHWLILGPRFAIAQAVGDVTVRPLDRDSFRSLLAINPKIAMLVFDKLCQRLRSVNEELQKVMVHDAKAKEALGHITLRRGMI